MPRIWWFPGNSTALLGVALVVVRGGYADRSEQEDRRGPGWDRHDHRRGAGALRVPGPDRLLGGRGLPPRPAQCRRVRCRARRVDRIRDRARALSALRAFPRTAMRHVPGGIVQ